MYVLVYWKREKLISVPSYPFLIKKQMHFIAKNIMKSFGQFFQMQKRTALSICDILIKMNQSLDIIFQYYEITFN